MNRAVQNLIWANVLVFIAFVIIRLLPFGNAIYYFFSFNPTKPLYASFYSIVTSIFLHDGFFHILGNMLWLYFVGIILEDLIGKKHIYYLFFGGGILGVFTYYAFSVLWQQPYPLVGASAGIAAVLAATAIFTPHYRVFLFGVVEIEIRWIVLFKVVFDLIGMFGPVNAGGYQAHIGGYLFGLLYITELKGMWNFPRIKFPQKNKKPSRTAKVNIHPNGNPTQEEIDRILDKISQGGYDSLSAKEKETLFKASNKRS
jgi:membrane associated rhomboid family serine protease